MLSPAEEVAFKDWFSRWANASGMNPNPDDPNHFYDYRAAFKAGVIPPKPGGHWPSKFKLEGHPRTIINGVDTRTGMGVGYNYPPEIPSNLADFFYRR